MELPQEFRRRMEVLLGAEYPAFEAALCAPLTVRGLRVNTQKLSLEAFAARFPVPAEPVPFCREGFSVPASFIAGTDPWHHAGAYYMQEPSAMSAVTVLAPRPGERVLDLCAAPGGKSTQIAAALSGDGLLWCNEFVRGRASALMQNLERCGVTNAVVTSMDTAPLCERLAGQFDAVLADVPCSGEGMFRKEPEALPLWSTDNIALCAARGHAILAAAAKAVRPGGRLVYSTCTYAPEENEGQILRFLRENPDFTLVPAGVAFGRPAFTAAQLISLLPDADDRGVPLQNARRILPTDGGEGHFIALLQRSGDGAPAFSAPVREKADANADACRALMADCFFVPPAGRPRTVGDTVRLLPDMLPDTSGLYLLFAGVAAATVCRGRLEPCHGIFTAMPPDNCRRVLSLTRDDPRAAAFLRGESVDAPSLSGWTAVAVDGVVTGFGKAGGGVLKNRYPKALRLRS